LLSVSPQPHPLVLVTLALQSLEEILRVKAGLAHRPQHPPHGFSLLANQAIKKTAPFDLGQQVVVKVFEAYEAADLDGLDKPVDEIVSLLARKVYPFSQMALESHQFFGLDQFEAL
jgi:hypothetical protein